MLLPKRTKYRKMMKGRNRGYATRGTALALGEFGLKAVELLMEGRHGLAVGVRNRSIIHMSVTQAVEIQEEFDYSLYNQLRDLHGLKPDNNYV
jgi:6-phosphofructokinase